MAEKSKSQIPRAVREQYEKGMTAFDRHNYDYAIAIFNQVLAQEPAFFDCRQALRVCQHKKSGGGSSFFKKMLSGAGSSPLLARGQLELMKDPLDAIKTAEQILNSDCNSAAAHKLLADAAMKADLPKTAVLSLEIVTRNSPKDEEAQKLLARAYSASGQGEKAEKIFADLQLLHPGDLRLTEELKEVSARKTLDEGGYEALSSGTGSYRDILKDKDRAVALEQEGRQVKDEDVTQRMINELEAKAAKEPNNLKLLRSLAELYTQKKEFDHALKTYDRIIAQEGNADASLLKIIADTTVKKFDDAIGRLDAQAPDYAEKAAQLKAERENYLLSECKQRTERYPGDLAVRFEMGELYFKAGRINEAMPEFQKAQGNPHKKLQALAYLGQCFATKGMNDMAARTLQNAIKEKVVFDDEKKDMIYALGGVLEKMGKQTEADDAYKQIYEVDMGYKDVMAKVEASYKRQSAPGS
jgi:predicted Zn-dependent protease